jgi:hypothetical protein
LAFGIATPTLTAVGADWETSWANDAVAEKTVMDMMNRNIADNFFIMISPKNLFSGYSRPLT